jgi:itaconate CoA-transferase
VQCEAGLLSVTGTPEQPAKAGVPVADIAAGMYALSSILAALYRRQAEGVGATLDITMFESLGEWMGFPAYFTAYGGAAPPRSGAHHATIVPYGPFKAGDGGTVFLSIQNEREFERFCDGVLLNSDLKGDPRFSSGPVRARNRKAMHEEIDRVFSRLPAGKILERLDQADIANAKLNSMQEFWDHPQLEARDRWREIGTPAGPIEAMKPPFNLDGFEPRMDAVPALGEHSTKILAELGFSPLEIQGMVKANIIEKGTP